MTRTFIQPRSYWMEPVRRCVETGFAETAVREDISVGGMTRVAQNTRIHTHISDKCQGAESASVSAIRSAEG